MSSVNPDFANEVIRKAQKYMEAEKSKTDYVMFLLPIAAGGFTYAFLQNEKPAIVQKTDANGVAQLDQQRAILASLAVALLVLAIYHYTKKN